MNQNQIEAFEQQLQSELRELEGRETISKESAAVVVLDQTSVGRLSRIDALQMQQMGIASEERRTLQIRQIKAALQRIRDGEYGYCLRCGEEIAPGRLAINPAVTLCVQCAD